MKVVYSSLISSSIYGVICKMSIIIFTIGSAFVPYTIAPPRAHVAVRATSPSIASMI